MLGPYCQQIFLWDLEKITMENQKCWWKNKTSINIFRFGRLFLDLGDRGETSIIERLPKGLGDLDHMHPPLEKLRSCQDPPFWKFGPLFDKFCYEIRKFFVEGHILLYDWICICISGDHKFKKYWSYQSKQHNCKLLVITFAII